MSGIILRWNIGGIQRRHMLGASGEEKHLEIFYALKNGRMANKDVSLCGDTQSVCCGKS